MKNWFEKYKELPSSQFTFENSGNRANAMPPFMEKKDNDFEIVDIHCPYGSSYEIVGYTKNPPFQPKTYHAVAIMFEDKTTFEKIWFHFRSGEDIDVRTLPAEYFGADVEQLRFESDQKWRDSEEEDCEEDDCE